MANTNRDPRQYEMMSILIPDMPEEETQAAIERIKGFLADANATVTQVLTDSPWGRRRLAYEMRYAGVDYRDGFYVLFYFSAQPHVLPEVERELKLDTQVIRYLLVSDDPKAGEKPGLQGEGAEGEAAATTEGEQAPVAAATQAEDAAATTEAAPAEAATETAADDTPAAEEAPVAETAASTSEDAPAEVAAAGEQVEETAAAIEGEEAPAPADAPAATEAPAAKRSSKLPADGEGADWVAGDGTDAIPDGFPIKGNATSKIYHPQESPNYANTIAEIYFANGDAAERFGYRLPKTLQNAGAAAGAGLVRADDAASEEE